MKHRVAELEGAPLDAAVARAEGWPLDKVRIPANEMYRPSTSWSAGGPIIERERMDFEDGGTYAVIDRDRDGVFVGRGPNHLVAAMRAYVASRFGEEVELP